MSSLYVLYEHASGYSLFRVREFEEIGMLLPQVEQSVLDLSKFATVVKLVAFFPFQSGINALDNTNSISEGLVHDDLRNFLESNLPKPSKRAKMILGVADSKIASTINEIFGITCQYTGVIPELLRGLTDQNQNKAQLGLGHAYSRAKVKFNVNRVDNMIIQSIALLDQLDKDINTFAMRIREWYGYHFPELIRIIPDNYTYSRVVYLIKNRKEFTHESRESELEEIVKDTGKTHAVFEAMKTTIGMDISPIDLINIECFANRVIHLFEYRKSLQEYLRSKMTQVAPNLAVLIGEQVGARLIAHAGSLTNLAKYPASTIQILGAEKALFRALKTKGNTPKYGLIFHSTYIGKANTQNKGRISRYLANKCAIASRIDCFSDIPTGVFGERLKQQVTDRLKFYDSGELPATNVQVMELAVKEAEEERAAILIKEKKRKKKEKKRRKKEREALEESQEQDTLNGTTIESANDFLTIMTTRKQTPSEFLKQIIGRPVVVKLNSGVDYRGVLACLDGYMNIVLEQTEEYVGGELKNKYGDAFIRGNNVLYISTQRKKL
ncbi:unnamed protein product [Didymodactylos carnosus]|uniref:Nucleolar protein 56 n=1 Tax=Didymodactylos carnosus TaxID=1234261 RepID=A0A814RP55_9BILA|nr:unnamed protein product [Didymodactylos carnosus]CAF1136679.1 unnamed protein product [Didymodactylos carnosus]CAF3745762.1 unnamed protein product [Didymodactylos carnosus]CAF3900388.1 unnamed protein product [Didymodactylos carnosus]